MFILKILLALLMYLGGTFLAVLFCALRNLPVSLLAQAGIGGAITAAVLIPLYLVGRRRQGRSSGLFRYGFPAVIWILLLGISCCIFFNNILLISGLFQRFPAFDEKYSALLYDPGLLTQILCTGLIIPLSEEAVFRGFLFAQLRTRLSWIPAALISSLIFAFVHGNVPQGFYALCLGMIMCWLYEYFEGLWAPLAFHVSANLLSVAISTAGWRASPSYTMTVVLIEMLIAAMAMSLSFFQLLKIYRKVVPTDEQTT